MINFYYYKAIRKIALGDSCGIILYMFFIMFVGFEDGGEENRNLSDFS